MIDRLPPPIFFGLYKPEATLLARYLQRLRDLNPVFPMKSMPTRLQDSQTFNSNVRCSSLSPNHGVANQSSLVDRPTKHPIVFCHGLMGFDMLSIGPSIAPLQIAHWRGIREALEAIGIEVLMARVPATSAPAERAQVLAQAIAERFTGKKVHLIGQIRFIARSFTRNHDCS
jgi:hypothetical protein